MVLAASIGPHLLPMLVSLPLPLEPVPLVPVASLLKLVLIMTKNDQALAVVSASAHYSFSVGWG